MAGYSQIHSPNTSPALTVNLARTLQECAHKSLDASCVDMFKRSSARTKRGFHYYVDTTQIR